MHRQLMCLSLSLLAFGVNFAHAADWPWYQGPDHTGISAETGLARGWPETGPKQLWSFPLGEGFGGAVIRDGEVYVLDRVNDAQDVLRCLSLDSGKELWTFAYDAPGSVSHDGSRTTPTVTEDHVYSVGMTGQFYCIDRQTHQPVWHHNLAEEYPPIMKLNWGYSQSPYIHENLVIVAPQSADAFVAAFDRKTGKLVWGSEKLGGAGHSTPIVATLDGVPQVVMISATNLGGVVGLALDDGRILWKYMGWYCKIPIPFATALTEDRLFVTGEYGAGSVMLQVKQDGGIFKVTELFKVEDIESQIHQPILHADHLYLNSNGNSRNDGMLCMALDGSVAWRTRDTEGLPRFERGGLLFADGMIIALDGKQGTLHLIDPSPEVYTELARAPIFHGSKMWAPMALSNGKLVLRSQEEMKCLDLRNP